MGNRKLVITALALWALFAGISRASATVVPVATLTSNAALVGDPIGLDLQLSLFTDFGYIGPALFTGGTVSIFSGESGVGPSTFAITTGVNFQNITANIIYTQPGDYTPSYTIQTTYVENALGFDCHHGCRPTLTGVTKSFNFVGLFFDPSAQNLRELLFEHDVVVTAAVPETSTWILMLMGFAGLGLVARRRSSIRGVLIAK